MAERCEYCREDIEGAVEVALEFEGKRRGGRFAYCSAHVHNAMRAAGAYLGRLHQVYQEESK